VRQQHMASIAVKQHLNDAGGTGQTVDTRVRSIEKTGGSASCAVVIDLKVSSRVIGFRFTRPILPEKTE
jgi:hypothetical protein